MANIPLKSIQFPGLSDTYTVPEIDNTLTVTGKAADAKKTGDEVSAIKADLTDKIDEVYNGKPSDKINFLNPTEIETGKQLKSDGTLSDNESYNVSGYIEIESGKTYFVPTGKRVSNPSLRTGKSIYRTVFYTSEKVTISAVSTQGSSGEIEIPNNVVYLRFSAGSSGDYWSSDPMVEFVNNVSDISTTYVAYGAEPVTPGINQILEDIEQLEEDISNLPDYDDEIEEIYIGKLIPNVNWLDPDDIEIGKQLLSNGTTSNNDSYNTSGYIEIQSGKTYAVVTGKKVSDPTQRNTKSVGRVCFYASDKSFVSTTNTYGENNEITIPQNAVYFRFTTSNSSGSLWELSPMVEFVDSVSEISDVFVPYSDTPQYTHGLNYLDETVEEISETIDVITPILDNDLIAQLDSIDYRGGHGVNGTAGSQITDTVTSSWRYTVFDVADYSKISVSTIIYGSTYPGVVFTDDNNIIIGTALIKGENVAETITDQSVDVPQYATKVYVNKRSSTQGDKATVKVTLNAKNVVDHLSQGKYELTLLAVNCGAFDYGDGTTTDAEYQTNWRNMLNSTKADMFALSDCPRTFGELSDESPIVLFGDTIKGFLNNNSFNGGLALATRITAEFIEQIDVGGGDSAWRKLVSKFRVRLMGKDIYVYVGHYQPESGRESIRATQYANVISDAQINNYRYVIFCGDFNAQTISEYAPFTTAGYKICNGGYTGDHNTLRTIPADNIIYSANMIEKHFEVITGNTLNTDHYPIMATLMIK